MVLYSSFQCPSASWLHFFWSRVRVQLMTSHPHPEAFTRRSAVFMVPVPSSSSVLKSTKGHFHVFLIELAYIIFLSSGSQLFVVWGFLLFSVNLYSDFTQWQGSSPAVTPKSLAPPTPATCIFTPPHNLLFLQMVACPYYEIKLNWSQAMPQSPDCWTITAEVGLAEASPEHPLHHCASD